MKKKDYSDIINKKRPPSKHPKMNREKRASQFGAFKALSTHDKENELE